MNTMNQKKTENKVYKLPKRFIRWWTKCPRCLYRDWETVYWGVGYGKIYCYTCRNCGAQYNLAYSYRLENEYRTYLPDKWKFPPIKERHEA